MGAQNKPQLKTIKLVEDFIKGLDILAEIKEDGERDEWEIAYSAATRNGPWIMSHRVFKEYFEFLGVMAENNFITIDSQNDKIKFFINEGGYKQESLWSARHKTRLSAIKSSSKR